MLQWYIIIVQYYNSCMVRMNQLCPNNIIPPWLVKIIVETALLVPAMVDANTCTV